MLPNHSDEDFRQSSFFKTWPQLPSPEDIRAQARAQYLAGSSLDKRKVFEDTDPQWNPSPNAFASMGFFVKWGSNITIAEG
ncbi:phosphotransferase enzyme family protein [Paracoccidioides lutzii Pb01]|uniref:Phosphotransferase enzyme family protein n=1 Tax=Paracoccidioides lutzii (strain ATCC MYA-826 / Pb01) TaxID=502779 RepID=C1H412_PARBA|nr:phosphotransferase enzyme family protein [Paracoccidioides lutzii Pb01]EEH34456.2 phosphotransferase enzyme family protein [Paracoccidioides lutzii Pb01]